MTPAQFNELLDRANEWQAGTLEFDELAAFVDALIAAEREACAKACDAMVDWPIERIPGATGIGSQYAIGVQRGLVAAVNAIRARSQ